MLKIEIFVEKNIHFYNLMHTCFWVKKYFHWMSIKLLLLGSNRQYMQDFLEQLKLSIQKYRSSLLIVQESITYFIISGWTNSFISYMLCQFFAPNSAKQVNLLFKWHKLWIFWGFSKRSGWVSLMSYLTLTKTNMPNWERHNPK